jgi:hypothetical protein
MTIRAVKFYLEYEDNATSRAMNRAHFGVMYWIDSRLRQIRRELRGPKLDDVDVVNVYFCENASVCKPIEMWSRLLNAIEYKVIFDVRELINKDPIENVRRLLDMAAAACALAPWPQVRAIAKVLRQPMTSADISVLKKSLKRWEAIVDKAADEHLQRGGCLH